MRSSTGTLARISHRRARWVGRWRFFILEVVRKIAPLIRAIAKHDPDLAKQLRRSASSMALNTAEGSGSQGGNIRARFRDALASTRETRANLDVADVWIYIAATLYRLIE